MNSFFEAIGILVCFGILLLLIIAYYSNKENKTEKNNYVKRNYRLKNDPHKIRKDLDNEYLKAYDELKKIEENELKEQQEFEKIRIDFAIQHGQSLFKIFNNNRVLTYEEIHDGICKEYNYRKYEYDPNDYDNFEEWDEGVYMFDQFIEYKLLNQCRNKKYYTIGNTLLKNSYRKSNVNINWENYLEDRRIELLPYPKDFDL
mgnify:CR=1 FL=1